MEGPWTRAGAVAGLGALVVGAMALVVAILAWLLPRQPAAPPPATSQPATSPRPAGSQSDDKRLDVKVAPSSYDVAASWWQPDGPGYESRRDLPETEGVTHAHAYGNSVGSFVYRVTLGEFEGGQVELSARLSADTQYQTDSEDQRTDVTVIVNGTRLPSRRVMPDDGSGAHYRWRFDASALRRGENTIEFAVERGAEFANGLAIYGGAIADGEVDEHITLRGE
ncbi:hypothetical protein [Saccharothrix hoggarensis]|uniref:Uncharacterized protein n=1 Tax=Saccharothrix hoggarensis TaxID=913853 RepID=A0ABW3QZ76_9PSEU